MSDMSMFSSLETLILTENQLNGRILNHMNVSYNNLTGTTANLAISFSVGCRVILASNQSEGSIPPFLQSATSLDLSKNKVLEGLEFLAQRINYQCSFLVVGVISKH